MKNLIDFSSRFRILKGGKISLVVSGLLLGSSLSADTTISTATTAQLNETNLNITITDTGSITNNTTTNSNADSAIFISDTGLSSTQFIMNEGDITALSSWGSGIYLFGVVDDNEGVITNRGNINAGNIGISLAGDNIGNVINDTDGTINSFSHAIYICKITMET